MGDLAFSSFTFYVFLIFAIFALQLWLYYHFSSLWSFPLFPFYSVLSFRPTLFSHSACSLLFLSLTFSSLSVLLFSIFPSYFTRSQCSVRPIVFFLLCYVDLDLISCWPAQITSLLTRASIQAN